MVMRCDGPLGLWSWLAQARKRGLAQQLLNRDPSKSGPMIGRDRLSALRANEAARNGGSSSSPNGPAGEGAAGGGGGGGGSQSAAASPSNNPRDPLIAARRQEQV